MTGTHSGTRTPDEVVSAPGGPEYQLSNGEYRATIAAVGATVRELTHSGRDLVVPYAADEIRPLYRGALIAPWPNRIADGRYVLDGEIHQLPLNEPDRGTALHGLTHWIRWELAELGADRVVLTHTLVAQPGYPFPLELRVEYRLTEAGLVTELAATNIGDRSAPYGCCPHPYVKAGPGPLDSWTLRLPASLRLEVDPDRLLPTGTAMVDAVDCDFRTAEVIGDRFIDHAFTHLAFDRAVPENRCTVEVRDPAAGTGVAVSWGGWATWVQIHTGDRPEPVNHRAGLAVEPMNCPPNAFADDVDSVLLAPGGTHRAEWTICALG